MSVKSDLPIEVKQAANKGLLYLLGVIGFIVLWLAAFGSNMLIYSTENIIPVIIPIALSIVAAQFYKRVSLVYPGASKIFGYAASTMLILTLATITLVTLSNGQSWLDIGVTTSVIGLIFPVVAVGFAHALEVFMSKLGLHDGDDSTLEHRDTLYVRNALLHNTQTQNESEVLPNSQ